VNRSQATILICLLSPGFCGCLTSDRLPYRDDPLLAQRKPLEGNPANARPNLLVIAEPSPPSLPSQAFVQRPPANWPDTALAARPLEPRPGMDEPDRSTRLEVMTASRHRVLGAFGHAADYAWLQGTVEFVTEGVIELRYDPSSDGDIWGGRVRLERDTRLTQIKSGDIVMVEGELLFDPDPATRRLPLGAPSYRVRSLWLVRRHPGA
jgi:hypothetical protein